MPDRDGRIPPVSVPKVPWHVEAAEEIEREMLLDPLSETDETGQLINEHGDPLSDADFKRGAGSSE